MTVAISQHVCRSLGPEVGTRWAAIQQGRAAQGCQFCVAAPLSSTPLPVYGWLIDHAEEITGWDGMRFVLMDELVEIGVGGKLTYVSPDDPASYYHYAQANFLQPLAERVTLAPDVMVAPELANISGFDRLTGQSGSLDLLILAVGVGGNYANVMPGTPASTGWHIAHLTDEFRATHTKVGGAYEGARFTAYGMSLGPRQVLTAGRVIVIASGGHKRDLVAQLLSYEAFDPVFPLSIVHHPSVAGRVELLVTPDAAS